MSYCTIAPMDVTEDELRIVAKRIFEFSKYTESAHPVSSVKISNGGDYLYLTITYNDNFDGPVSDIKYTLWRGFVYGVLYQMGAGQWR